MGIRGSTAQGMLFPRAIGISIGKRARTAKLKHCLHVRDMNAVSSSHSCGIPILPLSGAPWL